MKNLQHNHDKSVKFTINILKLHRRSPRTLQLVWEDGKLLVEFSNVYPKL
jgi:hypothetical protein